MNLFRRIVILSHRYLGILVSLLFITWFASAFTIIYTGGMPGITVNERLTRLPLLDLDSVSLTPNQAVPERLAISNIVLENLVNRPVYRIRDEFGRETVVYADTGDKLADIDTGLASQIAAQFLGVENGQLEYAGLVVEPDQWTLTSGRDLPMHKFLINDKAETQVYVSVNGARVSVYTTIRSRILAWTGAIPHWFYITALRNNQPLWYRVVVWSAGLGCVLTVLGLLLSIIQFRKTRPFSLRKSIPYRGWMRWHYILGTVFGIVILTWTFSGMLSMEPFKWNRAQGLAIPDSVLQGGDYTTGIFNVPGKKVSALLPSGHAAIRIEFLQVLGKPYLLLFHTGINAGQQDRERQFSRTLFSVDTMTAHEGFDPELLVNTLGSATRDNIVDHTLLPEYDDYYYARRSVLPLPVLRIQFDDPARTRVYVDQKLGRVVRSTGKWNRLDRWLYNGLHSLDFALWYHSRPLWDIGVILLLSGGLFVSLIGFYLGVKRIIIDVRNIFS